MGIARAEQAPSLPEYHCDVPAGLKSQITLEPKHDEPTKADAHAIYREYHALGWHGMMRLYLRQGSTFIPDYEPAQKFPLMTKARDIGESEAKAVLLKLEIAIGRDALIGLLSARYHEQPASKQDTEKHVDDDNSKKGASVLQPNPFINPKQQAAP